MKIADEQLEKLGNYFVYHKVHDRFGMTFEAFIRHVEAGTWNAIVGTGDVL